MTGVAMREVDVCCIAPGVVNCFAFLAIFKAFVRSASRFSSVPRSVFPLSSSDKRPDNRKRDSMRPRRFSKPSMYLALLNVSEIERDVCTRQHTLWVGSASSPLA